MNHGSLSHEDARAVILLRMEASRAALLATRALPAQDSGQRRGAFTGAVSVASAFKTAPRVGLLLALCVAAVAFGPRRAITVAARSALTAWLAGSARKLASGG
ncbi:hypothetical protein P3T43_000531 [Paraburkholderia sp. GAS41]|jgi:hypothetical protein